LQVENANIPEEWSFPKYGQQNNNDTFGLRMPSFHNSFENHEYYYDYAKYFQEIKRIRVIKLAIVNEGSAVARGVKLVLNIDDPSNELIIFHENELPEKPSPSTLLITPNLIPNSLINPDIAVKTSPNRIVVICELGKVQAKDTVTSQDLLCVGSHASSKVTCKAEVFCDDLDGPTSEELHIDIDVVEKTYSVDDFMKGTSE